MMVPLTITLICEADCCWQGKSENDTFETPSLQHCQWKADIVSQHQQKLNREFVAGCSDSFTWCVAYCEPNGHPSHFPSHWCCYVDFLCSMKCIAQNGKSALIAFTQSLWLCDTWDHPYVCVFDARTTHNQLRMWSCDNLWWWSKRSGQACSVNANIQVPPLQTQLEAFWVVSQWDKQNSKSTKWHDTFNCGVTQCKPKEKAISEACLWFTMKFASPLLWMEFQGDWLVSDKFSNEIEAQWNDDQ